MRPHPLFFFGTDPGCSCVATFPFLLGYLCSDLLSTACTPFDKPTNVHMPFDTAKETALRSIFPQHDIQLSCIVEDVLVVGLGRERGVQEP